jgi:hypothetical protein
MEVSFDGKIGTILSGIKNVHFNLNQCSASDTYFCKTLCLYPFNRVIIACDQKSRQVFGPFSLLICPKQAYGADS